MRRSVAVAVVMAIVVAAELAGGSAYAGHPSAVPAGFHGQSQSWVSPKHGWMLGSVSCGQSTCTTVVGTTDGGEKWNRLGTLDAPLTLERASGVTELRFADDLHGWAFEPALYATDVDAAYAVVSPCRLNWLCEDPATLWRATSGQRSWTQVSLTLPALTGFNTVVLAVHGSVAYLSIPASLIMSRAGSADPDVLDATVDGQNWSSRPDPCSPEDGETLTGIAPISDTKVALLCQANIGFGKAEKRVLRSNDTGFTTRRAGRMPLLGIVSQLAAAPNGTLVVSSYSIGSWIYRNAGGRTWTTSVSLGDFGEGWNDIVFTTNRVGFVIHGPWAFCCGGGPGELWKTEDGGVTWGPV
jgi:hypothetical protein